MSEDDTDLEETTKLLTELAPTIGSLSEEHLASILTEASRNDHRERHAKRSARVEDRRRYLTTVAREALPNTIGTVVGGAVLGLLAIAGGVLDDVPIFATAALSVIVAGGVCMAVAALIPPVAESFDEDAARARAERGAALLKSVVVRTESDDE